MNEINYISPRLSKLFQENWFEWETDKYWIIDWKWISHLARKMNVCGYDIFRTENEIDWENDFSVDEWRLEGYEDCPAYDILNDLCVKYAKEMFWEDEDWFWKAKNNDKSDMGRLFNYRYETIAFDIILLLQVWKKQEAEEYIREHCLFNPKNKN
jgi:hypothetical protein